MCLSNPYGIWIFSFSHNGVHAPYRNADRQIAVNHVAKYKGAGAGTAYKVKYMYMYIYP